MSRPSRSPGGRLQTSPWRRLGYSTLFAAGLSACSSSAELSETPEPGAAIDVATEDWSYVAFPDTRCQDGSPTGLGLSLRPGETRSVIFLQPGGACFDEATCARQDTATPFPFNAFGETQFGLLQAFLGIGGDFPGIFARQDANNPFKDWNHIFVPYCSGDVHAGSEPEAPAPLLNDAARPQLGRENLRAFLARLVPTLSNATHVLLAGSSAGGFGAVLNYELVRDAFPPEVALSLLSDAGIPLRDSYLAPCLQQLWRERWRLNDALPADCDACSAQADGGGLYTLIAHLGSRYPEARLGLIADLEDAVIRDFFGYEAREDGRCAALNGGLPAETLRAGLFDTVDTLVEPAAAWHAYLRDSDAHTFLLDDLDVRSEDLALRDWLRSFVDLEGAPPPNVVPGR